MALNQLESSLEVRIEYRISAAIEPAAPGVIGCLHDRQRGGIRPSTIRHTSIRPEAGHLAERRRLGAGADPPPLDAYVFRILMRC